MRIEINHYERECRVNLLQPPHIEIRSIWLWGCARGRVPGGGLIDALLKLTSVECFPVTQSSSRLSFDRSAYNPSIKRAIDHDSLLCTVSRLSLSGSFTRTCDREFDLV